MGVKDMCQALREMMEEANSEGRQEGAQDERIAMARRMLKKGQFSYEEIAELTMLTVDEIQSITMNMK